MKHERMPRGLAVYVLACLGWFVFEIWASFYWERAAEIGQFVFLGIIATAAAVALIWLLFEAVRAFMPKNDNGEASK